MFELFKLANKLNKTMKNGQTAVITKSERQMNISETGRALDMLRLAEYEDSNTTTTVHDPMSVHDWVSTAVNFRAQNIARTEFKLYNGDTEIENDPVMTLFDTPNPYMAGFQLWEATESWLCARGEALWVFPGMREETGTPTEIYVVDPTFYEHKLSPSVNGEPQKIILWLYKDEKHPQGIPYRPYEILHFKKWNKWDFWRGVSPLRAHRENIEQDVNANISNTNLIKNKSVPPGIIYSDQVIIDEVADKLIERWEKQHKGAGKAYKIAMLGRGAKFQPIALTNEDMGYMDMKKWNRTSILSRFGLTAGVFGFRDDSSPLSGTDTKEQLKSVWTLTLIPELKFLETVLKSEFFTRFGLTMEGKFDTDVIPELQIDKTEQETRLRENIKVGLYTINEAREEADKDPLDWGDVWWRPFNLEPEDGSVKEEPPLPQPGPFGAPKPPQAPGIPPPVIPPKSTEKSQRWLVAYLIESTKRWESLIGKYRKEIDQWFYRQRSWYLDRYTKYIAPSVTKTYDEFVFWAEQIELLKKFSKAYFLKGLELTGQDLVTVMRTTGFNTDFDIYQVNIGAVVDSRIDLLPRIGDTMQKDLSDLIKEGTSQGFTQEQLADAIRERFKDIEGKADTIARTELGAVKSEAQVQAYRSEGIHYIQWIHNPWMSIEPRPNHAALDGTTAQFMATTFGNGLYYPRDPNGDPGEVINCFTEDIVVEQTGGLRRVYKRWFDGDIITIGTGKGISVSGTPNHPILTPQGWVPLHKFNHGDYVISNRINMGEKKISFPEYDIQYEPFMFDEIFRLSQIISGGPSEGVNGTESQFHGDGREGNVNVVSINWILLNRIHSLLSEKFDEFIFSEPDTRFSMLTGNRSLLETFRRSGFSTNGFMRSFCELPAFFFSRILISQPIGLSDITWDNPFFKKSFPDSPSIDTEFIRNAVLRLSGEIFLDKIDFIGRNHFSGHVYNLQTEGNAYVVNNNNKSQYNQGIICHNCHCDFIPVLTAEG